MSIGKASLFTPPPGPKLTLPPVNQPPVALRPVAGPSVAPPTEDIAANYPDLIEYLKYRAYQSISASLSTAILHMLNPTASRSKNALDVWDNFLLRIQQQDDFPQATFTTVEDIRNYVMPYVKKHMPPSKPRPPQVDEGKGKKRARDVTPENPENAHEAQEEDAIAPFSISALQDILPVVKRANTGKAPSGQNSSQYDMVEKLNNLTGLLKNIPWSTLPQDVKTLLETYNT
jgi:hypothetical protein